jgi:hypothetical protein
MSPVGGCIKKETKRWDLAVVGAAAVAGLVTCNTHRDQLLVQTQTTAATVDRGVQGSTW